MKNSSKVKSITLWIITATVGSLSLSYGILYIIKSISETSNELFVMVSVVIVFMVSVASGLIVWLLRNEMDRKVDMRRK
jgi:tetrahydromethanopterin S-methyltransferase subunit C